VTLDCHSDHCITCGDEGIPMTVLRIDPERRLALCQASDGAKSSVEIALVEAEPGDELLVHAGVALVRLNKSPADCGLSTAGLSEAKPR
jgi:hydrogenase expression/formation protein HypC